ncbi:glycosyltransferase family 4 protein [Patescibacteria group bacterium]|nr:glycosyltransferase family 4 protein [Patescibacteria group bacterium]
MRLGIDISRAFMKEKTGAEEYSYQLIKHIKLMDLDDHQIFLYTRNGSKIDFDFPKNFFVKEINHNKFWTQIGLSLEMKKNPVDALLVPSYAIPIIHPKNTIATVHGLEYKYFPECYSAKDRALLKLNTLLNVKWSSKIIASSENTKRDLMKFYGVESEKIRVIYHGVRSIEYPMPAGRQEVLSIKRLNKGVFNVLFIGRLEKRKNLVNLIKAFEIFKKRYKKTRCLPTGRQAIIKLILAGKSGFGFDEIRKAIFESPNKNDIILKGYVSEKEKEELYKSADVFIMPSLYEGFGLPILEAMSYAIPVICSGNSSFPEVAGNAGLLVDPNNTQEIAEALNKILSNADFREEMIKRGFENAKKFSWEKCARETMNLLLNC